MARASAAPAPPPSPFWQLPAFRWGVLAVGLMLLTAGLLWLERANRVYQIERRIEEDARIGPMAAKLKKIIGDAERSGILKDPVKAAQAQVPQALWMGHVTEIIENENRDGSILVLSGAHLLAGIAGPHDRAGQVRIGRRRFVYSNGRPKVGQRWLIAVWRDGTGNAIHSAALFPEQP